MNVNYLVCDCFYKDITRLLKLKYIIFGSAKCFVIFLIEKMVNRVMFCIFAKNRLIAFGMQPFDS